MKTKNGRLILQTGEQFEGVCPEWQSGPFFGEVVFTTGMTGYVESLTDPSYAGQILVFTYPLIGNYGVPSKELWESKKIWAKGVVIAEMTPHFNHYQAKGSLFEWLKEQGVPLIGGIDTRALTKRLRISGVALGALATEKVETFAHPHSLVKEVSIDKPQIFGKGKKRIIAIDCGMKENILRHLLRFPIEIKRVPFDYDFLNEDFDGIFISNGPGDPQECQATIALLRKALERKKPTFGICLGTQLMGLSIGAKTYKLPFGHRGQNQPCMELATKRCFLTSQNHGYAVDETTLPEGWRVSYRNLNDGSVEGICHEELPFSSVQFHPEASPGPVETAFLFDQFVEKL